MELATFAAALPRHTDVPAVEIVVPVFNEAGQLRRSHRVRPHAPSELSSSDRAVLGMSKTFNELATTERWRREALRHLES